MQAELMQNERDKQERNIGPFAFDYDDDIESEVLTSEQVYRDLKELDDILGKNDAMRTEGRGKAKRWGVICKNKKYNCSELILDNKVNLNLAYKWQTYA